MDKCLVLDLDETCVRSYTNFSQLEDLAIFSDPYLVDIRRRTYSFTLEDAVGARGAGEVSDIWGVCRPGLPQFLSFCSEYFLAVGVWSAGRERYVKEIVDRIFRDTEEPAFVYTWDDTDKNNGVVTKPLQRVYDKYPSFRPENTFVLDDNSATFSRNVGNGILIPPYSPSPVIASLRHQDHRFEELQRWLTSEEVVRSEDVSNLDKSRIFL